MNFLDIIEILEINSCKINGTAVVDGKLTSETIMIFLRKRKRT